MSQSTKDEQRLHKHLCNLCDKEHECDGDDCAEFEFQTCPECKAKPQRRRRKSSTK